MRDSSATTSLPTSTKVPYDKLMAAFGGRGERIMEADRIESPLKTGLESREPALLDVVIDRDVIYPRAADIG